VGNFVIDVSVGFEGFVARPAEDGASHADGCSSGILGSFGAGPHGSVVSSVADRVPGPGEGMSDGVGLLVERLAFLGGIAAEDADDGLPVDLAVQEIIR